MKEYCIITPTNHGWKYGYGFFSNYRVCLEQLILHYESGRLEVPYISWKNTTWVEGCNPFNMKKYDVNINPYDCWFDQQIPEPEDKIVVCKERIRPDIINHSFHYFDRLEELKKQQFIDKLYNKPKQEILQQVDDIYNKEFSNHVVLGVLARGSEYNVPNSKLGIFGVEVYIEKIRKILKIYPQITKLFLVSEETEFVEKLSNTFPNSYYVPNVFRRTDESVEYIMKVHCWCNISTKRKNHGQKLGEETIIQTKLLGKCDYLLGRNCGILCGAVLWNERIKNLFVIGK